MGNVVTTRLAELFGSICKSVHTFIKAAELCLKHLTERFIGKVNCFDES